MAATIARDRLSCLTAYKYLSLIFLILKKVRTYRYKCKESIDVVFSCAKVVTDARKCDKGFPPLSSMEVIHSPAALCILANVTTTLNRRRHMIMNNIRVSKSNKSKTKDHSREQRCCAETSMFGVYRSLRGDNSRLLQQTMDCNNNEFWHQVNSLSRSLFLEWRQQNARKPQDGEKSCYEISPEKRPELLGRERNEILRKIERVILQITRSVSKGEPPVYSFINKSSWENVSFQNGFGIGLADNQKMTHVRFESLNSVKKFGLMTRLLSIIYKLVQQNKFCTKRDIFYQYPELFGSQTTLDKLVDTIACMLETPRWQLHVLATCKGSVAGDLHFYTEERHLVDCSATRTGVQIPAHTKDMQHMSTGARFVLIVEKDATFQKLVGDDFCKKFGPCIMVSGKGFPDLGTRLLLRRIWDNFHLPMFALVDADPHGIEIMAVYKHGSKAQAAENRFLAVPSIRWLGVLPTDINRLNIHESVCIPFTKKDMDKASELMGRPYVRDNPHLMEQIQHMIEGGVKCEIQCLDSLSPSYLTDVYLPAKLRYGAWI